MSDVSRETQDLMRRIVLPRARRSMWGDVPDGDDVPGGQGSYWFDSDSSSGGTDGKNGGDKEPPKKDKDKGKDGKDGGGKDGKDDGDKDKDKNGGFDPSKPPEDGDDAGVIEPLYDCGTGQCVDVILNPDMIKTPQGWDGPCGLNLKEVTDGERGFFEYFANIFVLRDGKWVKVKETAGETLSGGAAQAAIEAVVGGHPLSDRMLAGAAEAIRQKNSYSVGGNLTSHGPSGNGHYRGNVSVRWLSCEHSWYKDRKICTDPPKTKPKNGECFQVVSDGEGFKPVCNYEDLPPHLDGGGYSSFTLCDKDGNPVTVSRDGQGWKIEHPDYTARVGADFKVSHVVKKPK